MAQLSGHKNLKSLDSYMKASDQTQKEMSLSLSGNASDVKSKQVVQQVVPVTTNEKVSEANPAPSSTIPGISGLFSNDVPSDCTFNIAINYNDASNSTAHIQSIHKRRRITIDSDSD